MNILRTPNSRRFLAWVVAFLMIAGARLFAQALDTKPAPAAEGQPATPAAHPVKKGVYVGMPAAELMALIGKPDSIVQVPTKSGKGGHAEIWIYRRLINSSTEMITTGSKATTIRRPNPNGTSSDVVVSTEPVTRNRITDTYRVASFLIVNSQFVTTTQTEEKKQYFQ